MNSIPASLYELVNAQPSESDYATVGRIALQHTGLEYQLETLVWSYMGDVDKGHIATARLGIQGITDVLETLVEWTEPDDGFADAISWAVRCFHLLRGNRNAVVHGFNFKADNASGKLLIERRTKSVVFDSFEQFELTPSVLDQVVRDQVNIAMFIYGLQQAFDRRGPQAIGPNLSQPASPTPLPRRPAEPKILTPLPHEAPKSGRRLRQALAAKEAKEAMRGRRGKKIRP